MAKAKRAPKAEFSIKLPGGESLEFRSPGVNEFDRYVAKRRKREFQIAWRELAASCCISHTGEQAHAILKRRPALPKRIAIELDDLAGGNCQSECDFDDDTASIVAPNGEEIVIRCPSLKEWEDVELNTWADLDFSAKVREFIANLCIEPANGLLERYPSLHMQLLDCAAQLAGAGFEIESKKG